jgi:hypothetical protein
MHRVVVVIVAALAGCGSTTDDRPLTGEYIVNAILSPNCGIASCHASGTASAGLVFDTFENAQRTGSLMAVVVPGDVVNSELIFVLTPSSPKIMPPDQSVPDVDIDLMKRWIAVGAPGL